MAVKRKSADTESVQKVRIFGPVTRLWNRVENLPSRFSSAPAAGTSLEARGSSLPTTVYETEPRPRNRNDRIMAISRARIWRGRTLGVFFVLAPTFLAALYCFFLAEPMYVSSSRFAIRGQAETGAGSALGKILQGAGAAGAFTDGFAVRDYLSSVDALNELEKSAGFVPRVAAPRGDILIGLKTNATRERTLDFYRRVVKVRYNMAESIVSLDVYAFTPADAYAMARRLTTMAEDFSNGLNRKATDDALRVARDDLKRTEERLTVARLALNDWRKANSSLDVEADAKMLQTIVAQLETQLTEARAELRQLLLSGLSNSPRRRQIEDRIRNLEQQIKSEQGRLTSSKADASVVNLLGAYQRLSLEQDFASKAYELALQSLSNAQTVANVQQKFVALIVSPAEPEVYNWPDPWKIIPLTALASIFAWLLGSLAFSVIRDNARS